MAGEAGVALEGAGRDPPTRSEEDRRRGAGGARHFVRSVLAAAPNRPMLDGFRLERVDVGEAQLRVRHGATGPALFLIHGHPRTHATWHRVAPLLAADFTDRGPDLRGYGKSSKP